MRFSVCLITAMMTAGAAIASCPNEAPEMKWNAHSGDIRVGAKYLQKLLEGKKVKYDRRGTEVYNIDGRYFFLAANGEFEAPSFKFYDDGTRCINYPNPRFDMYVVNENRLIIINPEGERLHGRLLKESEPSGLNFLK